MKSGSSDIIYRIFKMYDDNIFKMYDNLFKMYDNLFKTYDNFIIIIFYFENIAFFHAKLG